MVVGYAKNTNMTDSRVLSAEFYKGMVNLRL